MWRLCVLTFSAKYNCTQIIRVSDPIINGQNMMQLLGSRQTICSVAMTFCTFFNVERLHAPATRWWAQNINYNQMMIK